MTEANGASGASNFVKQAELDDEPEPTVQPEQPEQPEQVGEAGESGVPDRPVYVWVHDDDDRTIGVGDARLLGGDLERCYRTSEEPPKSVYVLNPDTGKLVPVSLQAEEAHSPGTGFHRHHYKVMRGPDQLIDEFAVLVQLANARSAS